MESEMTNPMTDDEIRELEQTEIFMEKAIELGEALNRLRENSDFKKVIMSEYLEESVLSSVSLLADPAIKRRGERPEIMEDLVAASNLRYFFMMVDNAYKAATQPILSEQEEEELQEELDNAGE